MPDPLYPSTSMVESLTLPGIPDTIAARGAQKINE